MAVSVEPGKRRARKPTNSELNLVPYIDLLTCMIAFLLIAAVWTSLARLKASQRGAGEAGDESQPPRTRLTVLVHGDGFNIVINNQPQPLGKREGVYDFVALGEQLHQLKLQYPDLTELMILSEDPIMFETLIQTMDVVLASGFPDVSLQDATKNDDR
ncbi:MAG TPA: biopolymer transporter ExbD [Polyangia bacterium]